MKKIYEVEVQRSNITPKAFFRYCSEAMQKHGANIEDWADYESWANEKQAHYFNKSNHEDWDDPQLEIYSYAPFEMQIFLARAYNFILEFTFDTDKKGSGYLYAVEFER